MVYTSLQKELFSWFKENFWIKNPKKSLKQQLIGIIEEHGELCHAVLKLEQGIRLNENHEEKIKDAVGDVLIYLVNAFSIMGINLCDIKLSDEDAGKIFTKQFDSYREDELYDVFDYIFMLDTKINDLLYDCNSIIECNDFNDVYKHKTEYVKSSCENCVKYTECFNQDINDLNDDFILIFYLLNSILCSAISGYVDLVSPTQETMLIYRLTAEKVMKRNWNKDRNNAGVID